MHNGNTSPAWAAEWDAPGPSHEQQVHDLSFRLQCLRLELSQMRDENQRLRGALHFVTHHGNRDSAR